MSDNWLVQKSQIKVEPLQSNVPVLGLVIAKFRNLWGAVAAKWMVQQLASQQNEFNRLIAVQLQTLDERLIEQDHDLVALTRQVAEMNVMLHQMQNELQLVNAQLTQFEESN